MKQKLITLIILIWIFNCLKTANANQEYYFETISPEAGFAFDAIYTISQDCNGFIWFGSNNGLFYYNTSEIKKINLLPFSEKVSQSLTITDILHDNDCQLWVCAKEGLFKRNYNEDAFDKLMLYTKDSVYSTEHSIQKILQFDEELYFVLIGTSVFYFNINEMILYEIKLNSNNRIRFSYMGIDKQGKVLLGTVDGNVYTSMHPFRSFSLFYTSTGNENVKIICDDNNKYYIGFENGVDVINRVGDYIYCLNESEEGLYNLPHNSVRDIIKTDDGEIWIGTYKGIVVLKDNKNTTITNNLYNGLPHESIYEFHKGKNGGVWIGTWAGGIAYYHEKMYHFNNIKRLPNEKKTKSLVSSFEEDDKGIIWVGSEQGGVNLYNLNKSSFETNVNDEIKKLPRNIKSLVNIGNKKIFVGTIYKGIWSYDLKQHKTEKFLNNTVLDDCNIYSMVGNEEELWIAPRGARKSLICFNFDTQKLESYIFEGEYPFDPILRVWSLLFDSSYRLWVATEQGLFYQNKNDTTFQKCIFNDSLYKLDRTMIYDIYEDTDEKIWLGTKGKGVFMLNPANNNIKIINTNKHIVNADVYSITGDEKSYIWFSTDRGIFQYDKNNDEIAMYTSVEGLPGDQFIPNSIFRSTSNHLFFGSSNGFCFIKPSSIEHNDIEPNVFFTKLLINNTPYKASADFKSNSKIIEELEDIELNYDKNSLTFGVAANNFIKSHKNRFKYRLINYDSDWIYAGNNTTIAYTKIPPGNYTLEVLGSNNDNEWSESPLTLDIIINYPIWLKWYAFLFYIVLVQLIAYFVIKETILRFKLKKQIVVERYKGEVQEQLLEDKTKFFTNISHEIRTPLTLIISPVENLLNKFRYDDNTTRQLLVVKRNSSRLLRLTNQILDYRLVEVNKLELNVKQVDVVNICKEVIECFDIQIKEKQINLIFSSAYKELYLHADSDKIEKIVYNLLSNAIKFSHDKGQVFLSVECADNVEDSIGDFICVGDQFNGSRLQIKVSDYGRGIKKEFMNNIFERFSMDAEKNITGIGVGLHLCKEYASLHKGNIVCESVEGKGTTFTLNIPLNESVEGIQKNQIIKQFIPENQSLEHVKQIDVSGGAAVVLLAEDNDELRLYLKDYLQVYYKVIIAKNGQQAYEITKEVIPDIIITDILMPLINGIEFAKKLQQNNILRHIPIIVLTALSEKKYQKESFHSGIESFLTKPVDETILFAQIESILNKRRMIKSYYLNNNIDSKGISTTMNLSFLEKAERIVEENIHRSDFDLQMLIEMLNMSRSSFLRKIKKEANQSPSEFIRDIRLKCAVNMMKNGNCNIDEIGSYVGFNSTSYFIRSFKNKYGRTPKDYYRTL